ncbi:DNA-methyltransferase [Saccharothrix obliqua]|uniref:DNA-methyltransferase n=1 Tax=Saccharothrix obliqua TaxID=2861747 RepID=UPI001C605059|nr:site-specific DNA-methyltransferase [Saccharothrix obliqua]MBW4715763.1 site-specific DNA-methyltransferase [Saccharothrix obliqua]
MDDRLAAIKEELGKPYFENSNVLLYQGDCADLMSRLSQPVFDLVVTSPPYNIGKAYEKILPLPEYIAWCGKWMTHIHEVTLQQGSFWLNVGYVAVPDRGKAVPLPYLLWDQSPFFLVQEVIWNYGAGVAAKRSFSPRNEKFLWYAKDPDAYYFDLDPVRDSNVKYPNQKKNGKIKVNPLGKNPTDVWQFPKVTSGASRSSKERTAHPAQFPVAVIDRIIKSCSPPSGLVLDPFVGSGTTCAAARQNGRLSVGFDLKSEYLDIAAARLEASEQHLF